MKNFMMNFIPILTAEVIAMVACFILAGYHRSQELYTLGEFLILVFILTVGMMAGRINKNKDE